MKILNDMLKLLAWMFVAAIIAIAFVGFSTIPATMPTVDIIHESQN
jgi:hypothetical protein